MSEKFASFSTAARPPGPRAHPEVVGRFQRGAVVLAILLVILGAVGFAGWFFDSELLKSFFYPGIAIKTNTALGFIFAGAALTIFSLNPRSRILACFAYGCALVVTAVGGLTFIEHLTGWDFHIDQLLFAEVPGAPGTLSPNRMGPPAAIGFTLAGIALLLLNRCRPGGRCLSQYLALLLGSIAFVPLIGYAYGVLPLFSLGPTGIAAQTALGLAILAAGILFARPTAGSMAVLSADSPGSVMARRLLPSAVLIPFLLGLLATLADHQQIVAQSFSRPFIVIAITIAFALLVWTNAGEVARIALQREQAEDALRESDHRFRVALNTAPVCVCTQDTDLRYTWICNPPHGLAPSDMLGKRDDEIFPPDDVAELLTMKRRVLATGRGERRQIELAFRGRVFTYDVSAEPLRDGDGPGQDAAGQILGLTVAYFDITTSRETEKNLFRAKQDAESARGIAEAANAAKDQFLAVLSHELRTPLTPVMTLIQIMESDSRLPPELRETIVTVRRNVQLEVKLIDDLLDLTRVTHGKLALQFERVDLHQKLRHVVQICQNDFLAKDIRIELELHAPSPFVHGDGARLQQVFWNVLKNSIKFTPSGGVISIRSSSDGTAVRVAIEDNGMGIDADSLPRIFNAFEQGQSNVPQQFGGLGLGLAISKSIVQMHNGAIHAASRGKGLGCTVTVTLPACKAADGNAAAGGTGGAADDDEFAFEGLRILLVEDNADTTRALSRLLKICGCHVKTASSVASALSVSQSEPFDLLLSDVGLPDGSGHDLMRRLQSRGPLKGIAISGFGMEHDIQKSLEAGFTLHLTKPVSVAQLKHAILQVVSGHPLSIADAPAEVASLRGAAGS